MTSLLSGPVLVLGGTAEAREVASGLQLAGVEVVSSLAGRLVDPNEPEGNTRIGGFGGPVGLADWIVSNHCTAVVDATHPFAMRISASAASACSSTGVPLLRLHRPGWTEQPGDRWHWVDDVEAAAALTPRLGSRALLSIGRQRLEAFAAIDGVWFLIRSIDEPTPPMPPHHQLILARGPFRLESELELLRDFRIDLVVTRDSGGGSTEAKLRAARMEDVPVIVIRRPTLPEVTSVGSAAQVIDWVRAVSSDGHGAT